MGNHRTLPQHWSGPGDRSAKSESRSDVSEPSANAAAAGACSTASDTISGADAASTAFTAGASALMTEDRPGVGTYTSSETT